MSSVSSYVDNLFCGLPATEEVLALKQQITESLEDKQAALMTDGCTKQEALGILVEEFGNMEEIYHSLGYAPGGASTNGPDPYQMVEYEEFRGKYAAGIAFGVMGMAAALLIPLVVRQLFVHAFQIDVLCLTLGCASLFSLVYWCIRSGKYRALRRQLRQENSISYGKQVRRIAKALCSLIMPVFTLLFFILGGLFGKWHPAWMLFPVGGLLCGIIGILGKFIGDALDH